MKPFKMATCLISVSCLAFSQSQVSAQSEPSCVCFDQGGGEFEIDFETNGQCEAWQNCDPINGPLCLALTLGRADIPVAEYEPCTGATFVTSDGFVNIFSDTSSSTRLAHTTVLGLGPRGLNAVSTDAVVFDPAVIGVSIGHLAATVGQGATFTAVLANASTTSLLFGSDTTTVQQNGHEIGVVEFTASASNPIIRLEINAISGILDNLTFQVSTAPVDTDGDGLLDATEIEMAGLGDCPDPTNADSDGDTLSDGDEVLFIGTDPCNADTDGDGVPDDVDDLPTDPGVSSGYLEEASRDAAADVLEVPVVDFNGPNDNANCGRRNSLANRANTAANLISEGDIAGAIDELTSLLEKIDGLSPPKDWMDLDAVGREELAQQVSDLIVLLQFSL